MAPFKFSAALPLKLALITSLFTLVLPLPLLLAAGIPQRWEAKQYQPPASIGRPRRVAGAGTRSPGSCPVLSKALTALTPNSRFGVTVTDYPTFFVYIPPLAPQANPPQVEFVLRDANKNDIYKTTFKTTGTPGILTLSLPAYAGLAPLQVGQDYQWSFSLICQPDERSRDITVEGWIRRVEPNPSLTAQLNQASLQRQVELYAEAEIWHEALAMLVQLRRNNPNDTAVTANWVRLLSAAGLNAIAQESLMPTSTTPANQLTLFQGGEEMP